mgnify:CR=1 FL=1
MPLPYPIDLCFAGVALATIPFSENVHERFSKTVGLTGFSWRALPT